MLKLVKIAVTGGLACGKSTVSHFFKELGAHVVSADEIVHQLLSPNTILGKQVIKLIGLDIVVNHQIDRARIASKVFNNPKLLSELESLLYPAVYEEMNKLYQQAQQDPQAKLFVAEVPLLFEAGFDYFFDAVVAVTADDNISQQRFQKSTGYDLEEYKKRATRQFNTTEKARRADFVIVNNGTLTELRKAVKQLFNQLQGIVNGSRQ